MAESTQEKLRRVRPPRVHLKLDVELEDARPKNELPFVVGVMGDFSGDNAKDLAPLSERKSSQKLTGWLLPLSWRLPALEVDLVLVARGSEPRHFAGHRSSQPSILDAIDRQHRHDGVRQEALVAGEQIVPCDELFAYRQPGSLQQPIHGVACDTG